MTTKLTKNNNKKIKMTERKEGSLPKKPIKLVKWTQ